MHIFVFLSIKRCYISKAHHQVYKGFGYQEEETKIFVYKSIAQLWCNHEKQFYGGE